jgi:hypothetical protein
MNELSAQKKSVIKKYMQGNTAVVDSRWHRKMAIRSMMATQAAIACRATTHAYSRNTRWKSNVQRHGGQRVEACWLKCVSACARKYSSVHACHARLGNYGRVRLRACIAWWVGRCQRCQTDGQKVSSEKLRSNVIRKLAIANRQNQSTGL